MNAFIVLYMLSNFDNVVILSFRFVLLRSMNSCCFILSFVSLFARFLLIFFFYYFTRVSSFDGFALSYFPYISTCTVGICWVVVVLLLLPLPLLLIFHFVYLILNSV